MSDLKTLADSVRQRKAILERVEEFLDDLWLKRKLGNSRQLDQTSSTTHTKWELHNFHSFWFEFETGSWGWGGNDIRVWYNPRRDVEWMRTQSPCLEFEWRSEIGDDETKVKHFSEEGDWLSALTSLMGTIDAILREDKADEVRERRARVASDQIVEQERGLREEASRLGMNL